MFASILGLRFYAYVAAGCLIAGFAAGWYQESKRFDAYQEAVEVAGKVQEALTLAKIESNKRVALEVENELRDDNDNLDSLYRDAQRRLSKPAGSGQVPAPSPTPASTGGAVEGCRPGGAADRVAEALRRYEAGSLGILHRGDQALIDRAGWRHWSDAIGAGRGPAEPGSPVRNE